VKVSVDGDNFLDEGSRVEFEGFDKVDPVAVQTKWTLCFGGTQLGCQLNTVSNMRLEFGPGAAPRAFGCAFILAGVAAVVGLLFSHKAHSVLPLALAMAVPLVFFVFGSSAAAILTTPVVFDKSLGCYWKGGEVGKEKPDLKTVDEFVWLKEIHALQLIYDENPYASGAHRKAVQLNIVLHDGSRFNVSHYTELVYKPNEHAAKLSQFLDKPVWDATETTKKYWTSKR